MQAAARRAAVSSRRPTVVVRAGGDGGIATKFSVGQKVKVIKSVKFYGSPKFPEGLDLAGQTGVMKVNCQDFKGKVLSANLPYRCEFNVEGNKILAHLVRPGRIRNTSPLQPVQPTILHHLL